MPEVLRSPRVRRIMIAFAINRLGSFIGLVAMLVLVYDRTGSGLAVSGLLLCWQALPAFAVPPLVARVEASTRGRELSALYLFEALATAGLAVIASSSFSFPLILVLAALDGTASLAASALLRAALARAARDHAQAAQGGPRSAGAIAETATADGATGIEPDAGAEAERAANAALNVFFSFTFVIGPAVGGVLVASAGAATALVIDAVSFALCGLLLLDLRPHIDAARGDSVRARLVAAREHIRTRPLLRSLLLVYAVALSLFETAAPIEVALVKTTLSGGDGGVGLLLSAWGGGAVVGSILFARTAKQPLAVILGLGTLAIGLADLGFALAPGVGFACVAAVVGGLGNGVELPALMSLVQQMTPTDLHGRILGAVESVTALSFAVGLTLGGLLVAVTTPRVAFAAIAAATIAVALILLRLALAGLNRPQRGTRPRDRAFADEADAGFGRPGEGP